MRNLVVLILLLPLFTHCQTEKNVVSKYPANVGDIAFDEKSDDSQFKRCLDEKYSFQYYNDSKGFQFKGEKIELERKLETLNLKSNPASNGFITIRFLVNCEGKTGMFRVQQMNEHYEESAFDKNLNEQLLDFTKKLNGWMAKEYRGLKLDYYQYLTFKIENGKVSEILP